MTFRAAKTEDLGNLAARLDSQVREQQTGFRYPQKVAPGCYEVMGWVSGAGLHMRFRTERDALRFFWAAERGVGFAS